PFEELSDIGSSRADDHEHLMLPEMLEDPYVEVALQAPPSPNYIPGPEEPEQVPPSPDYVPGDDGDDKEESSEDDEDDEMDVEADKEEDEEKEHSAPADSVVVAPTAADQALSADETEPFETDESVATPPPHPAYRTTSRISIPALVPMPAWTDTEVVRLLAISSPPASPLPPWSSPPPHIPFPPLTPILSPPSPVLSPAPPPSPIRSLGYRATMIRLRDEAACTLSPPLQLPSASRREDRPEVTLPPRKRLDIALGLRYKVGESSSAAAARPAGATALLKTKSSLLHALFTLLLWHGGTPMSRPKMFSEEDDKIEKYVGGLPDMIHGSVVASKPNTMNNAPARVYAIGRTGTDPDANVVTVIVCAEKIVRIPWGNETLIIHGDGSNRGNATRLSIISCTKTEKYVKKGFPIFLAHITTKEVEDKSEKKLLEDVPIV
nr:reverse transcriptase domain-containing protein [Tanacetum cinerariifolium]